MMTEENNKIKFTDTEKDYIDNALAELDQRNMTFKLLTKEKILQLKYAAETFKNTGDENLAELYDKLSNISEKDFEDMFLI